ncbi:signal peptidase II [Mycobacterium sp.]|uniref:signal peptidase II n=1 Tax=Mycobacterium sp. TaxID=1785 RepID=UPI003BB0BEF1
MNILLLAGLIVAADRATKEIAVRQLAVGRHDYRFVRVVLTQRPLLGPRASLRALIVLWVAAIGCMVAALLCAPALRQNTLVMAGIAAALAGALGNLGDRIIRGAVVDFVAIGRWPVFNLADVAIVAGAAVAGVSLIPIVRGW